MYDFAFDWRSLEREFVRSDFSGHAALIDENVRRTILNTAVAQGQTGFLNLALDETRVRGKALYQTMLLPQELLLRKLARNVRLLTKVRQTDRDTLIRSLTAILSEGHDYRVYKLDVRHFYESLERTDILAQFERDAGFPPTSFHLLRSFFDCLSQRQIEGLPRGLAISATLSEYAMRRFDALVRARTEVYFYARYVDDIIIVTRGDETQRSFMRFVRRSLPAGLTLNNAKCKVSDLNAQKVAAGAAVVESTVDFLGYRFGIFVPERLTTPRRATGRRISIDVAPNKVTRFKTRIVLSLRQFVTDNSFEDLHDRLRLLTGNYNLYDFNKKLRRNVGIAWNYRHVNLTPSPSLSELDRFLLKLLLSNTGSLGSQLHQTLQPAQQRQLLALSFQRSFASKEFYHFNAERLTQLVSTWTYA